MRQLGQAGIALIQRWEALRLTGYIPLPGDRPTAGWGHTGPDVQVGTTYPLTKAQEWFQQDTGWACSTVENSVLHLPFGQNQFDACVSLVYNIGTPNWLHSTVLREINFGDLAGAADAFLLWDKEHGSVLQGLLNRREEERQLFLTPDDGAE